MVVTKPNFQSKATREPREQIATPVPLQSKLTPANKNKNYSTSIKPLARHK